MGRTHFISKRVQNQKTQELLERYNMADRVSPTMKMRELSIAQIQMMEIIKAVSYNARVIIMDEPTSSLSENETRELFKTIRLLKENGVGIIYISHRMEEVFELSDRISVLRDGQMIGCLTREEASRDRIISMMVGRALSSGYPRNTSKKGKVILSARALARKGAFEGVSFDVREGEILGFAGLVGAGPQRGHARAGRLRPAGRGRIDHGRQKNRHPPSEGRQAPPHHAGLRGPKGAGADPVPQHQGKRVDSERGTSIPPGASSAR